MQQVHAGFFDWISNVGSSIKSGFETVGKVVVQQAKAIDDSGKKMVTAFQEGKVGEGFSDLAKVTGQAAGLALTGAAAAITAVPTIAVAGVVQGSLKTGGINADIAQKTVETTGMITGGAGDMLIGGSLEGVVGTGKGLYQVGGGIGQLAQGNTSGFETIGKGLAETATQAANIVAPLPIDIMAPGSTEGIIAMGHGLTEIAQGNVGKGFADLGTGTAETAGQGAALRGVEATVQGAKSGDWSQIGMGIAQVAGVNEVVTGVENITDAAKTGNVAEGFEGVARLTSAPVMGGGKMYSEGAMAAVKAGEGVASGISEHQGALDVAMGGLGGAFTGASDYGKEEFQGTTSEEALTGGAVKDDTGDAGAGADAGVPTITNNFPTGYVPETGTTFCVACGSRNGQFEAWTISADATKLLRYDATQTTAQNPWVTIPAVDNQGKDIGMLIYVSVSSDGQLMIVDVNGLVYRYDWDAKNFTALPVSYAYQYDDKQGTFVRADYGLALNYISIGSNNDIWGVDAKTDNNPSGANIIYQFNLTTNTWEPNTRGTRVSAGVDGTVVGIDTTGAAMVYAGDNNWYAMPGTNLDHIAVGSKDYIYGSYLSTLWQYTNNAWVKINGADNNPSMGVNEISVNAAGSTIITDLSGNIFNKGEDGVAITQQ